MVLAEHAGLQVGEKIPPTLGAGNATARLEGAAQRSAKPFGGFPGWIRSATIREDFRTSPVAPGRPGDVDQGARA
jgi:hypothetical protein